MSDPIQRLILELARLPGIGERSAARLAFYILRASHDQRQRGTRLLAEDLAAALGDAARDVGMCELCYNLCAGSSCSVCVDARRDPTVVCVVESVGDLRALESSGGFHGVYHVLHGSLAPLDGVGPEDLKIDALMRRIRANGVAEVILATNTDIEGDATALYIGQQLRSTSVRVTRLASGVPMGENWSTWTRRPLAVLSTSVEIFEGLLNSPPKLCYPKDLQ